MTNKEKVQQGFDLINQRSFDGLDQIIGPNYVNHDMPAPTPGPEGLKAVLGAFIQGFPDMKIVLEDKIAEGDLVCTRGYFTGTHKGEFMGIPATNKSVKVNFIDVWRFEGGLAAENWVRMDNVGMMQQLGLMPG